MFGELNTLEIENLVRQQYIGRIGCHADGITYVVPISYAYDGTYIYGHGFEGRKIEMMRKNPVVCFEVDDTRNLANWQSVIMWGDFEELEAGPEREKALQKLEERAFPMLTSETMHLNPLWPFHSQGAEDVKGIFFRIRITQKTGRFEKTGDQYFFAT